MACEPYCIKEIFCVFGSQIEAFNRYDELSMQLSSFPSLGVKIYSFERETDGKRKFLVASWSKFLDEYLSSSASSTSKHFYEIIREGNPCRLYFDLEFPLSNLEGKTIADGDRMTAKFLNVVVWTLHRLLGICCSEDNIVVLDSSSETKYSKHVIFLIQDISEEEEEAEVLFRNNVEINKLIDHIFAEFFSCKVTTDSEGNMSVSSQINPLYADLFYSKADSVAGHNQPCCFVDKGVYTRNRAFRIFGSSKFGKSAIMKQLMSDKKIYRGAEYQSTSSKSVRSLKSHILLKSFVCPLNIADRIGSMRVTIADIPEVASVPSHDRYWPLLNSSKRTVHASLWQFAPTTAAGTAVTIAAGLRGTASMFPELDKYVSKCPILHCDNKCGELNGWTLMFIGSNNSSNSSSSISSPVRREDNNATTPVSSIRLTAAQQQLLANRPPTEWLQHISTNVDEAASSLSEYSLSPLTISCLRLRYAVINNKYCWNIQRQHKSNSIFVEVDIYRRVAYQKCWDPDCRGFRGPPLYIPEEVNLYFSDLETIRRGDGKYQTT